MSNERFSGTVLVRVLRVTENPCCVGWDLREHPQRRARQAIRSWKCRSEKIIPGCVWYGDPEFEEAKKFWKGVILVAPRAWFSKTTINGSQSVGRPELSEREYICVVNWRWWTVFTRNATQDVAKKLNNLEWRCYQKENYFPKNIEDWKNFLRSMISNHEQWVYSSAILTFLSGCDIPTFLIKLLLLCFRESLAAKLECRGIHERIWVFLQTFLIVNMLDECLKNYTMIQEIWQHHLGFREKKELRKMGAKNHCTLPCFSVRARRKSLDDK